MATNAEKYPDLWAQSEKLRAEKAEIQALSVPMREQRDVLRNQMAPLEAQLRELDKKIKAIELPRMAEIDNQLAALARVMGAKSVSHREVGSEPTQE